MATMNIAIEIGTSHTSVYLESAGVVLREPTAVAYVGDGENKNIVAVGEKAMRMLKAKLYQLELQKSKEKINELKGESSDNSWGNQIRSYVFCPYTLVKDHRTNFEIGNVQKVMDGYIDEFIVEYLKSIKK